MTKPLPFKMIQETKLEKWRADWFWGKEPETLKWIESFEPGSYLADVGANIGQYTLYAASLGHHVAAFEPQPASYQALLRNIGLNKFHNLVVAFPFALASKQKISAIQIGPQDISGRSGVQIQQSGNYFVQCVRLNPDYRYVKIDVDGIELDIVKGMYLGDKKLKSALVEISPENEEEIWKIFYTHGFDIDLNFQPESIKDHSTNHRKASGSPVRNVVFTREKKGT